MAEAGDQLRNIIICISHISKEASKFFAELWQVSLSKPAILFLVKFHENSKRDLDGKTFINLNGTACFWWYLAYRDLAFHLTKPVTTGIELLEEALMEKGSLRVFMLCTELLKRYLTQIQDNLWDVLKETLIFAWQDLFLLCMELLKETVGKSLTKPVLAAHGAP